MKIIMENKIEYSKEELKKIHEVFNCLDELGDGKIRFNQIGDCVRILGQNPTEANIKICTKELKSNERVTFEKFLSVYQEISKIALDSNQSANNFIRVLRYFENFDEEGFIPFSTLRHFLVNLGEKLTEEEIDELFCDRIDSKGNINYKEFVKTIMEKKY